jgi:hypothetical protein
MVVPTSFQSGDGGGVAAAFGQVNSMITIRRTCDSFGSGPAPTYRSTPLPGLSGRSHAKTTLPKFTNMVCGAWTPVSETWS